MYLIFTRPTLSYFKRYLAALSSLHIITFQHELLGIPLAEIARRRDEVSFSSEEKVRENNKMQSPGGSLTSPEATSPEAAFESSSSAPYGDIFSSSSSSSYSSSSSSSASASLSLSTSLAEYPHYELNLIDRQLNSTIIHPPYNNAALPSNSTAASCSSVALGIHNGNLVNCYDDDDEYLNDDLMLALEKAEREYSAEKSLQKVNETLTCDMSQSTHLQSQHIEELDHTQDTFAAGTECHSQEEEGDDQECHSEVGGGDQECHSQEIDGGDEECHSQEVEGGDCDQECHSQEVEGVDEECHSEGGERKKESK